MGGRCLRGLAISTPLLGSWDKVTSKRFVIENIGLEVQMVGGPLSSPGQEVAALGRLLRGLF